MEVVVGFRWLASLFVFCATLVQASPDRPFPQELTYGSAAIRPTTFTQAEQNQHVRTFYDYWKAEYLVPAGTNAQGQVLYRVAFGEGSTATVSEGQGYGMIITALMAGYDPEAKVLFDGLWRFSRAYPSGIDSRLMSWKVDNGQIVGGNASAFDGDADIAYGLLLASAQWGVGGEIDYAAAADSVLAGVLASTIGPDSRLPMLGDWVNPNGATHSQYTPRSSDFMPGHFAAFARHSGDGVWNSVNEASEAVMNSIQNQSGSRLLPDFIIDCNAAENCRAAPPNFLEDENDGDYYYNAGRAPWRIGLDAIINDDNGSAQIALRMLNFFVSASGSDPYGIAAGYKLNGDPIGNYFTSFFVAPIAVAAMLDSSRQAFLNALYNSIYRRQGGYYEDSVNLLSLLVLTGNFWDPTLETGPAACRDGVDNDDDGLIDHPDDPGCQSGEDRDETDPPPPACNDGQDNDGDGDTDFPDDAGCNNAVDNDEYNPPAPACRDGLDNDGDTLVDYPDDPGCSSSEDNGEIDSQGLQLTFTRTSEWNDGYCSDVEIYNPGSEPIDWVIDFEIDEIVYDIWNATYQQSGRLVTAEGVSWNNYVHPQSTRKFGFCAEQDATPASCNDGRDNDGDGLIDYPDDPGCDSAGDEDEYNAPPPACADNEDNDGDGLTDYPDDPGCENVDDNDEYHEPEPEPGLLQRLLGRLFG